MEYIKPRRLSKTELRFLQEKINLFLTFLKTDVFSKLPSGRWTKLETFMANDDRGLPMDDEAKRYLVKEGYDPQFGARPLKRTVQEQLLNPLATRLLDGDFKPGDHIKVRLAKGELTFET